MAVEATEEEVEASKKKVPKPMSNKAPLVDPSSRSRARSVATPVRSRGGDKEAAPASPSPAAEPSSGNPQAHKRLRGKVQDPDKDRQIEQLRKAGFGCLWDGCPIGPMQNGM